MSVSSAFSFVIESLVYIRPFLMHGGTNAISVHSSHIFVQILMQLLLFSSLKFLERRRHKTRLKARLSDWY